MAFNGFIPFSLQTILIFALIDDMTLFKFNLKLEVSLFRLKIDLILDFNPEPTKLDFELKWFQIRFSTFNF